MKPKNGSPCRQSLPVYHAIKDGIKYPLLPSEQTKLFLTSTEHQPEDWKQQQDLEKSPSKKKEKPK